MPTTLLSNLLHIIILPIVGFIITLLLTTYASIQGFLYDPPHPTFHTDLNHERTRQWTLSTPLALTTTNAAYHAFLRLSSNISIHYLTTQQPHSSAAKKQNLIIFIHGYPDSSHLWLHTFTHLHTAHSATAANSVLVALDLPGFGASDSLVRCTSQTVLDAVAEFIVSLRRQHGFHQSGEEEGKVIIVGHDWGAVITSRLALEAPALAHHFVLCNGPVVPFVGVNVHRRVRAARQAVTRRRFAEAWDCVKPILVQFRKSYYVLVFTLPLPLRTILPAAFRAGDHFFHRALSHMAVTGSAPGVIRKGVDVEAVKRGKCAYLAGALGPNAEVFGTKTEDGTTYSTNVQQRTQRRGGWGNVQTDSLEYYRGGIASGRWRMSEVVKKSYEPLGGETKDTTKKEGKKSRLTKPVTIIWGKRDPALDWRVMVEGVEAWSEEWVKVRYLRWTGHWGPCEENGVGVEALGEELVGVLGS